MLVRILLADDHSLFREMLKEILPHKETAYAIVGEAADGAEVFSLVARHRPDLLLLDYKMPGVGRLSAFCQEVTRRSHTTRTLIVSGYAEEDVVLEAAIGGAQGYILKGTPLADLFSAIATIHAGGTWVDPHLPPQVFRTFLSRAGEGEGRLEKLSRQELTVLSFVARGMSNKEIGARIHISEKTVKNHLTHIFAKLGAEGRRQAARYFLAEQAPGNNVPQESQG